MSTQSQNTKLIQALINQSHGLYSNSIQIYTELLSNDQSSELLLLRGISYLQQNNLQQAIKDFENAIIQTPGRYEGYLRRGICNFKLGNIQSAQIDFNKAKELILNQNSLKEAQEEINKWLEKCEAELLNADFKKIIEDNNISQQKEQNVPIQNQQQNPASQQIKNSSGKIAYSWYQTNEKVVIEINYCLQNQSQLKTQFKPNEVELSFPIDGTNDYNLQLELFDSIEKDKSEVKCGLKSIEIIMFKAQKNFQWKKLEKDEDENKPLIETKPPSYPSSSKYYKDWNKLEKEIDKEFANEKNEDPMAGIFGEIYRNADENTKRAMIKSYQTSGGTVLSTNWDEVKSKDYEGKDRPEAPKGQAWQKWEK